MRNMKLTLEYDGSRFFGFQRQKGRRTVQSELEKALRKLFIKRTKISSASGRTDAGVHATGQVVNVKTDSTIPLFKIQLGLNTYLPEDLAVVRIEEMPDSYHARFQAKRKRYEYAVWNHKVRSPLQRSRAYHFPYDLDMVLMQNAAKLLVGRHDFKSFQAKWSDGRSDSVRTIHRLGIKKEASEVRFVVEGDGFLYNMVRNIVGTLLFVGCGKISLKDFKEIIRKRDRRHAGPTVPAHGLVLVGVVYD